MSEPVVISFDAPLCIYCPSPRQLDLIAMMFDRAVGISHPPSYYALRRMARFPAEAMEVE